MKTRNWILILILVVMIVPFVSTTLFVSYLTDWYEREEVSEYIHSSIRINALASELKANHRLFQHPRIAEKVLHTIVKEDEIVHLYSKDRHHIYSIHQKPMFRQVVPTNQLLKGLYETKETLGYFIYKEPVYQDTELIGYFEIKKERQELKKQIERTSIYTFLFFIGSVMITMIVTHFLVKKRIGRPLSIMMTEMKSVADGGFPLEYHRRRKEDEFSQLMDGFYEMSKALQIAKENEAKTQAMKQQFIAAVSHDLRTPLTSIKAYAEGMKDHQEKQEEYREIIVRKANYMEKLINDLLLYSRLEMNEFKLNRQLVDGEEMAEMLVSGYEEIHNQKGVLLKVAMDVTPCELDCDVDRLTQVMDNIVSNAIRYTPQGKTVELFATNSISLMPDGMEYKKGYVYFLVKDEGIGIEVEEQEKIFTLFYQIDEARRKENNTGAGLGLSISKGLVERHGGLIGVHSCIGIGSIVYFALPMIETKGDND